MALPEKKIEETGFSARRWLRLDPEGEDGKASRETQSHADAAAPGATEPNLINWLVKEAESRGKTTKDLASDLGVSYSYLALLRNGTRDIRQVSDEFISSAAAYLGVPRIRVMMAAGKVQPEDFMDSTPSGLDELKRALEFVRADPNWGLFFPNSLLEADSAIQQFVMLAYEQATGKVLITRKHSVEQLLRLALRP